MIKNPSAKKLTIAFSLKWPLNYLRQFFPVYHIPTMSHKNTFVKLLANGFWLLAGGLWSFTGGSRSFVHSYLHRRSYSNGCKMFTKNKYIYIYIYIHIQIYANTHMYIYIYPFTYMYHRYTYINIWYIYVNGYINIYYIYIYI